MSLKQLKKIGHPIDKVELISQPLLDEKLFMTKAIQSPR